MEYLFVTKKIKYDGTQLSPLWGYLNHQISGDSIVCWVGPCDIPDINIKDAEDLVHKAKIKGSEMLHFIIEVFDWNLKGSVGLQRLFASIVKDKLNESNMKEKRSKFFVRKGDDIYFDSRKLSISIASISAVSCQIHFAMNVNNKGTPVRTCSLSDFGVSPRLFAEEIMKAFVQEFEDIVFASQKVKPL